MPRTTYGMLASSHLYRVYSPRRGDLAFYGSGHVEFVTACTTPRSARRITERGWAGTTGTPTGTRPCTSASAKEGLVPVRRALTLPYLGAIAHERAPAARRPAKPHG